MSPKTTAIVLLAGLTLMLLAILALPVHQAGRAADAVASAVWGA